MPYAGTTAAQYRAANPWNQQAQTQEERERAEYAADYGVGGQYNSGTVGGKWYVDPATAGLQAAVPPVTPQGTAAVATAGTQPPPGLPSTAVPATPAAAPPQVAAAPAAQPAATPAPVAPPRRRMVTQASKPIQGLRAANGAGY